MRGGWVAALALMLAACAMPSAWAAPGIAVPPAAVTRRLPSVLPAVDGIREPLFALLVGLAENDLYGTVASARLRAEVARTGRPTRLPVERIVMVRREPGIAPQQVRVSFGLTGPLDMAIPYNILGYHPGRFRASPWVVMNEFDLGTLRLDDGTPVPAVLEDVRVWGVREGKVVLDVDGWLDRLMGGRLDDTRIVGLAAFRYQGERYGIATGYNPDGQGRSGAFRFRDDEVVFPGRPAFMALGRYTRRYLEQAVPGVRGSRP